MKYVFLGGAGEVGGSCLLISAADRYILIDCGIPGQSEGNRRSPRLCHAQGNRTDVRCDFLIARPTPTM